MPGYSITQACVAAWLVAMVTTDHGHDHGYDSGLAFHHTIDFIAGCWGAEMFDNTRPDGGQGDGNCAYSCRTRNGPIWTGKFVDTYEIQHCTQQVGVCPKVGEKRCMCYYKNNTCVQDPKVHGGWASWTTVSSCTVTCGEGYYQRSRTCTNPAPSNGGRPCQGASTTSAKCNSVGPCPDECVDKAISCAQYVAKHPRACDYAINYKWCEKTCDKCKKPVSTDNSTNNNSSINNSSTNNNSSINNNSTQENFSGGVDGRLTTWTRWGSCSITCGGGSRTRVRSCVPPTDGGAPCSGRLAQTSECSDHRCPMHGSWGSWYQMSECSHTCGGGTYLRLRDCDDPPPMFGGDDCTGTHMSRPVCNDMRCRVMFKMMTSMGG